VMLVHNPTIRQRHCERKPRLAPPHGAASLADRPDVAVVLTRNN
jgi:hypothetical protein